MKKGLKVLKNIIVFLTILAWVFSDFAFMPNLRTYDVLRLGVNEAQAANTLIRQEINIIDAVVTAAGDDSAIVQLDTTKYTGATYYFETVAQVAGGTLTVALERVGTATQDATISVTATSFFRQRSVFTPPAATQTEYNINLANGTTPQVKSARIIILQSADPIANTQTQIEIGNNETGKTNTTTAALTYPKYWYYDANNWDGATFYAEVTYKDYQVASSTTWSTAGTYTNGYVVSPGTSYAVVEAWGGGGGGGIVNTGGGGGGGGAYARSTTTPAVGSSHTLVVGAAGLRDTAAGGGNSTYDTSTVIADGGNGTTGISGGTGGSGTISVGDVEIDGGTGGIGLTDNDTSGGGGGAGGPNGAGNIGQNAAVTLGGAGGSGNAGSGGAGGTAIDGQAGGPGGAHATGGGGGGGADTNIGGGVGGAPGGGGGGSENAAASGLGAAGQIKITETHGAVGIALEKDNGSFTGWTFVRQIVTYGTATSSPARVRSDSFTPETGLNYRITASTTATTASYDIYNAKIIVDQSSPTKLEPQYLLANTNESSTGLRDYDTSFDPAEWAEVTNTFYHEINTSTDAADSAKLQVPPSTDITNSTATGANRARSPAMVMPGTAQTIDVNVSNVPVYASRIIVQCGPPPSATQSGYRWFENNNGTQIGGNNPLANENSTTTLTSDSQEFRLRMLLHVETYQFATSTHNFKLQHASTTETNCASPTGTWTDVTQTTEIAYKDNLTPNDGDAVTATSTDPTHLGHTRVYQTYEELNNFTSTSTIAVGQDGLWDFSLYDNSAPAGTTYCLRTVKSNNSALGGYDFYPALITYSAATVSCSAAPATTNFGTLTAASIHTSVNNVVATTSCTYSGGCVLYVNDAGNGTNPGLATTSPAYLILSQTATLEEGNEGYGIQTATTSYGTGQTLTLSSTYNKTNNDVGGLATTTQTLASAGGAFDNKEVVITHKVTISPATYYGNYNDTIYYSCTGQ